MADPSQPGFPSEPSYVPIDAPAPQLSRRRHHVLTLPSSVLVVICMFLPTLEVCGDPVMPAQFPPFYSPYVIAALVFAATLVRPWRLFGIGLALRIVMGLTAVGWTVPIMVELDSFAVVPFLLSGGALAIVLVPARTHELAVARCATTGALGSTIWFVALATDAYALWGAYVAVFAGVLFTLGCSWWWFEAILAYRRQRWT